MCNDTNRIGHKTHCHKQRKNILLEIFNKHAKVLQQIYALFAITTYFIAQNVLKYVHGRLILEMYL